MCVKKYGIKNHILSFKYEKNTLSVDKSYQVYTMISRITDVVSVNREEGDIYLSLSILHS